MDKDTLIKQFDVEMEKVYRDAYAKCRHNAHVFFRMLNDYGGLETAQRLLKQHDLSYGFERLCECGCCYITMEALILREPWRGLFDDKERNVAITRLQMFNYDFNHEEIVDSEE